ncbi:indolepyruvate ferredoxin oxidoreductase family protein [Zavarzinia aquatilis]|uniref:Indolepyruvate ferredoxin oxidoreductase family protein n=1 Tax=Zavarzinia aquatilis TaxID=2211142 RepID=A0A317EBJ4_9PROT|nr:indolepyruvate ferredoxin oxidoreductase family protein [Zavarzinia aquatilis]PWR24457.1 indolepyruvate ferredoxin oxidoreductase family protein [Zavarzinia aquatilis]
MADGTLVPADISLDDKYRRHEGRIYLNGMQALVRLALEQHRRDTAAGLNTAGFISGYRGSPLGGFDLELERNKPLLEAGNIRFQPGVNEDLAATALWGTQQVALGKPALFDGVFGFWYGKGPGVDRTGDVFKHANLAGTAPLGGVLAIAGDDHTCKSSTTAHQTEYAFVDAMIPVLAPSNLAEVIDFGLAGIALSRFAGTWAALKLVSEIADTSATIPAVPAYQAFARPTDFTPSDGGLHIRWPDTAQAQEARLHLHKLPAVLAFARANPLNRVMERPAGARLGIVTAGKAYGDLMQAFDLLGLDKAARARHGIAIYKIGLVWPLEPEGLAAFAEGLEEILVVEEKRPLIEDQVKALLYGRQGPRVSGKRDGAGHHLLKSHDELSPVEISDALARRLHALTGDEALEDRRRRLTGANAPEPPPAKRTPYFCSGCPHNTSTKVPEGSQAHAGIGCHYMATWMDRSTETFTHMGGEGANWIGQAPFVATKHIFQNLGDGTYFHSGLLALRAAVAARVPVTYKILYNDAVAMTGGQHHDGPLTPAIIAAQVRAEGVTRIALVAEDITRHRPTDFPPGTSFHGRDELDAVQRELREIPGVTVIIYDQACAAEKRRRRKRGLLADPLRRVVINEAVCEGCGDCGVQSNCLSIVPVDTEFGRKRQIDQSSCNKDYSCLKGFCPSFVSVDGAALKKPHPKGGDAPDPAGLPAPPLAPLPWSILALGIGGTGIVTLGALIAMAAHVEGKEASVLDQTGLAQKGGGVTSHIRIGAPGEAPPAPRIPALGADLVLAADAVVAAGTDARLRLRLDHTAALVNSHVGSIAEFTHDAEARLPMPLLVDLIRQGCGTGPVADLDATHLATALTGDALATNIFLLGIACQRGLLPVAPASIEAAIALNRTAARDNLNAFRWGRAWAHDAAAVETAATATEGKANPPHHRRSSSLDEMVARRAEALTIYQNERYAARYQEAIARLRAAEQRVSPGGEELARAAADGLFRLMAYKDEYEVARLQADPAFRQQLDAMFEPGAKVSLHLSPPLLARPDPATGRPAKHVFGPWIFGFLGLLRRLKILRGTPFDPFGRTEERRTERRLRDEALALAEEIARDLSRDNHAAAVALMALPARIRGFGPVKMKAVAEAEAARARLLAEFRREPPKGMAKAAE